ERTDCYIGKDDGWRHPAPSSPRLEQGMMTSTSQTQVRTRSRWPAIGDMLLPFAGVAIFVVAFEAVVRLGVLPQRFFPPPSVMVWALSNLITQPEFHWALWNTLSSWAAALLLAAVF